jgi:hypothetical protein
MMTQAKTSTKEILMKSWKHVSFKAKLQQRHEDTERINLADNACEGWNSTVNMEINFQVSKENRDFFH